MNDIFATTRWTVVLQAGNATDSQAAMALEELCRSYWFPLYAYVRRQGHSKEDAEDLIQGFFARFLKQNYLENLDPARGRFRAFLLGSLKHFLANEWDRTRRLKRGGHIPHLSLDWQTADTQFQVADSSALSPELAYDRDWATALLAKVLRRLHSEWSLRGRSRQFEELKPFLAEAEKGYETVAARLGIEAGALRTEVHRLRKRYRQLLREEIAQTVAEPGQLDQEMQALFAAFRS